MEFGLSQEQKMLESSIDRTLRDKSPLERVQAYVRDGERRAADVWAGLCAAGVPGLIIPEEHGGVGLGLLDAALVSQTLGSHVAPAPFAAAAVMAPMALVAAGSPEQKSKWLPAIASGEKIVGAALTEAVSAREGAGVRAEGGKLSGRAHFVIDFDADAWIVADTKRGLHLAEAGAAGLTCNALSTIDATRGFGELVFDNTPAEPLPGATREIVARLIDAGRVVLAADTLGAARTMLKKSVAYTHEREQFGRKIGSFQSVKHMCAEMAAGIEPCVAMMWYAAHVHDAIPAEARLVACHLKAHVSEIGTFVAQTATEVHGGIGFTDEFGLHLWFKRIGMNRQLLGGPRRVRAEAAAIQGLG